MATLEHQSKLDELLPQHTRVCQTVVFGMLMGVLFFGGFAVYARETGIMKGGWLQPNIPLLTVIAMLVTVSCLALRAVVIPKIIRSRYQSTTDSAPGSTPPPRVWLRLHQLHLVTSCAVLEGSAMTCLVAYLVEGEQIPLAVAGLMVFGIVLHFPTQARILNWIEDQERYLREQFY